MENLQLEGKKVAVLGLGARTGVSVIRYLCESGARVTAMDQKPEKDLIQSMKELVGLSFTLKAPYHDAEPFESFDLIIVSPGVPTQTPFWNGVRSKGKMIWSEIELASRILKSPIVAVTGTNGKSTTTSLVAHLLTTWGKKVFAGGNLGTPLLEARKDEFDFLICETSSFQLEAVESFHPHVGLLLNVYPNHLDRHGDMATYVTMKERLFAQMGSGDRAIFNRDNAYSLACSSKVNSPVFLFSMHPGSDADFWYQNHELHIPQGEKISLDGFKLLGPHNLENALAAVAAAYALGCPAKTMEKGLRSFRGLAHRLEWVAAFRGVQYINDSKSTTPEATLAALASFDGNLLLLAGGYPKGATYESLANLALKKVRYAVLFGPAAKEMSRSFLGIPHVTTTTLKLALEYVPSIARSGDTVLFSPANASFDEFEDYEERGRFFCAWVKAHGESAR